MPFSCGDPIWQYMNMTFITTSKFDIYAHTAAEKNHLDGEII
jgi:hypothetical protein